MEPLPKKLYYKIGEVCDLCEIQPHVLRYWETEFSQLSPAKNTSGQRVYRYRELQMVRRIKQLLYEEGYTIAGANKKLSIEHFDGGTEAPADLPAPSAGVKSLISFSETPFTSNGTLPFLIGDPVATEVASRTDTPTLDEVRSELELLLKMLE